MYKDFQIEDQKSVEFYLRKAHEERSAAMRAGFLGVISQVRKIFANHETDSVSRGNCRA
jgi:hypothetical protein